MTDQQEKKSPAFQFYAAEFLADENVALMNNRQLGCYIKLMSYCWREKSIPSDITKIAKLCGEDGSAMADLWDGIGCCFDQALANPNRLVHPRLDAERIKQTAFKKERSESGTKGAKARWGAGCKTVSDENSGNSSANSSAINDSMAVDGSSSSFASSTSVNIKDSAKYSALDDLVSRGVRQQTASDWLAVRKAKKSAATKTAIDGVLREIEKTGMSADEGIRLCCVRGWASFNPAWLENLNARAGPGQYKTANEKAKDFADVATGRTKNEQRDFIDINTIASIELDRKII